jgi:uncharacterized protein YprB with RNaseH-like and TPR domain
MEEVVAHPRSLLRTTFQHLSGIGRVTERRLWERGIRDWKDLKAISRIPGISEKRIQAFIEELERSELALSTGDVSYFAKNLRHGEHWRLYPDFRLKTAFMDIETTDLSPAHGIVTCVTVHGGGSTRTLVHGKDIDELDEVLRPFALMVTFNGYQFDVPFLAARFPSVSFPPAHADLRWLLYRQGLTGGLKSIERQLGIGDRMGVEDIDGWEAVRLWYRYRRGDNAALEKLVAYNRADTQNLEPLMDYAVGEMVKFLGNSKGPP